MRRIIAFDRVSADGYFAAPDGNLDWVVQDPQLDKDNAAATKDGGTGTLLFGRKTYEMFESFWPKQVNGEAAQNPHGEEKSKEMHDLAVFLNDAEKIVFSHSMKEPKWKNSRVVREFDPKEIERMKKEHGKDIMIFGSGEIVSQLADHNLIDEYQFIVNPVLLGSGKPLVHDVKDCHRLDVLECKPYSSGNILMRFTSRKTNGH